MAIEFSGKNLQSMAIGGGLALGTAGAGYEGYQYFKHRGDQNSNSGVTIALGAAGAGLAGVAGYGLYKQHEAGKVESNADTKFGAFGRGR